MYSAFQSAASGWEVPSKVPSNEGIDRPSYLRTKVRSKVFTCVCYGFFSFGPGAGMVILELISPYRS